MICSTYLFEFVRNVKCDEIDGNCNGGEEGEVEEEAKAVKKKRKKGNTN